MEKSAFLAAKADDIEIGMLSNDIVRVHKTIGAALAKPKHGFVSIQNRDGRMTSNAVETKEVFRDYFGSLLNATPSTMEWLV
eukprot:2427224-Karenia_brevis.AAC.1